MKLGQQEPYESGNEKQFWDHSTTGDFLINVFVEDIALKQKCNKNLAALSQK